MKYRLVITPSIDVEDRQKIQDCIESLRYHVTGGGTKLIMPTSSDITFERDEPKDDPIK